MSGKHKILIVDDEINILKALRRVLMPLGHEIHITVHPQEALEILKNENLDLIISDQRMPLMPGIELLKLAKDISPRTKRILISGFSDHDNPEDFINYGEIVSYIPKPWVDEEIKLVVSSIMEQKKLEDKNKNILTDIQKHNRELESTNKLLTENIKNKRKQIEFVENIIETSKLQLKTINEFLYIINSSDSIKDTFRSLFSTIYNILHFEEIGTVYANFFINKPQDYRILNVMKNERIIERTNIDLPINIIKKHFMKRPKLFLLQDFNKSISKTLFKECFLSSKTKQAIILPLFNRDKGKNQFIGFIFLGSHENNFFQSNKLTLFTELLFVLANTVSEMIVFERIKVGGFQWEQTFDAIQDPLILINKNYKILRANTAAVKLTQTGIKNLIGKNCFEVFTKSKEPCEICPVYNHSFEGRYIDHSNDRYYNVKVFPIEDNHLIYYKDYTETKQLYYKLIQSDKMAAIGQLAGQVAHEINNPLAGLLAYTQLLLHELNENDKFYKYFNDLKEIETASLRCKNIVENLLSFSSTHLKDDFISVNVRDVIKRTLPLARYILKVNKIDLKLELNDNVPEVLGSFNQLQQVVFNLITNACHAMTGGGTLTISTLSEENSVIMKITDTGNGIPEGSFNKIFDPFYTTKEKNVGTGLGLYICHEILQKHSGEISVVSKIKEGSSFTVKIPVYNRNEGLTNDSN